MNKKRLTIHDIKRIYEEKTGGYYFSRKTLKFFHQRMRDFKVTKIDDETYFFSAPAKDFRGKHVGFSEKFFDVNSGKLFGSIESLSEYKKINGGPKR